MARCCRCVNVNYRGPTFEAATTAMGPLLTVTTVSLLVAQFIASQKPFMAFGNVPKAAFRRKGKLTLAQREAARD